MKSTAATAEQYLASLPEDRRAAMAVVREHILEHLDMKSFEECMQYGVVAYCVRPSVWPHGHHTNPKLGLMYMGFSSQKNDMVVYMLFLHHNTREREWFDAAWKASGRKNYLEVTGGGCCLRFKKLEELSLEVIGEAMRRMPVKKYLEDHGAMLERIGKAPAAKKGGRGKAEGGSGKKAGAKPVARAKAGVKKKRASRRAK